MAAMSRAYQQGRTAFINEKLGLRASKQNWQIIGLLLAASNALGVAGCIYLSSKFRVAPYVVTVDSVHNVVSLAKLNENIEVDEHLYRHAAKEFIEKARLLTPDRAVQQVFQREVWALLTPGKAAASFYASWEEETDRAERMKRELVNAQVTNVLKIAAGYYQVSWMESRVHPDGSPIEPPYAMQALIGIRRRLGKARSSEVLELNPLGFEIEELSWGRDATHQEET